MSSLSAAHGGTTWHPGSRCRRRRRNRPDQFVTTTSAVAEASHSTPVNGEPGRPPILFIHGWSQCHLCWSGQVSSQLAASFRMVTFDNRGHGTSGKPLDPGSYADERLWADDLAAVIDQTGLDRPVLVGGTVLLRPPAFDHIGPGMLENAQGACAPDLLTNIHAIRRFLRRCTARPLDDELWSTALCWNMAVPPEVRGALIAADR